MTNRITNRNRSEEIQRIRKGTDPRYAKRMKKKQLKVSALQVKLNKESPSSITSKHSTSPSVHSTTTHTSTISPSTHTTSTKHKKKYRKRRYRNDGTSYYEEVYDDYYDYPIWGWNWNLIPGLGWRWEWSPNFPVNLDYLRDLRDFGLPLYSTVNTQPVVTNATTTSPQDKSQDKSDNNNQFFNPLYILILGIVLYLLFKKT